MSEQVPLNGASSFIAHLCCGVLIDVCRCLCAIAGSGRCEMKNACVHLLTPLHVSQGQSGNLGRLAHCVLHARPGLAARRHVCSLDDCGGGVAGALAAGHVSLRHEPAGNVRGRYAPARQAGLALCHQRRRSVSGLEWGRHGRNGGSREEEVRSSVKVEAK